MLAAGLRRRWLPVALFAVPGALSALVICYRLAKRHRNRVVYCSSRGAASNSESEAIVAACPSMQEYRPTPWLLEGSIMQTMLGVLMRSSPNLVYERTYIEVYHSGDKSGSGTAAIVGGLTAGRAPPPSPTDGGIALDWLLRPRPGQPVLIVLHGLTGGSSGKSIHRLYTHTRDYPPRPQKSTSSGRPSRHATRLVSAAS
jgi:hypothetical protein